MTDTSSAANPRHVLAFLLQFKRFKTVKLSCSFCEGWAEGPASWPLPFALDVREAVSPSTGDLELMQSGMP
jgi:hypothetical protein